MINKLDLGNTMFNDGCRVDKKGWTAIDLEQASARQLEEGGYSGDEGGDEGKVQGDFFRMPFADETFIEVFGCCYLEEVEGPKQLKELFRVVKKGGTINVSGCAYYCGEGESFSHGIRRLVKVVAQTTAWLTEAGFRRIRIGYGGEITPKGITLPHFKAYKPKKGD